MTKKEMKRRLDRTMLFWMNDAIDSADKGYRHHVLNALNTVYGVVFAADALGLIGEEEWQNINHTLACTSLKW